MCGIVGVLDLDGSRPVDRQRLSNMAAAVRHRGPDDGFGWVGPRAAMATQRLAIQDAPRGRQPMCDPSGRVHVSFNGELFNAEELRAELSRDGHTFSSRCDTELWPALYLSAKEGAFRRARGQFAVAIWDREEGTLLLGRDRLGICPLYFAVRGQRLLWASEIKGLFASGLVEAEADLGGVDQVMSTFAAATRRTCFRGVEALLPGHFLRARGGQLEAVRYWDIEFPNQGDERTTDDEAELVGELQACLDGAVRRRLTADGAVGAYLSGGLDSSLIVGLAARATPTPLASFTVGFAGATRDERGRAQRTAQLFGARPFALAVTDLDIAQALPAAVLGAEGPIMDTANACLALLAEQVRASGIKAVLSGEGADEALGGYAWHKAARSLAMLGAAHPLLPRAVRDGVARLTTPGAPRVSLADQLGGLRPSLLELYEPLSRAKWLFYGEALRSAARGRDPFADVDVRPERMRRWHPLNQALYLEYKLMLPGHLLLGKGDRVGMRSAVENRYPFLDEAFVDLCASLSPRYKLRGFTDKWLLRQVAARVLPREMASPPKSMFKAKPLCELSPRPGWVSELTSPEALRRTGYFSEGSVRREEALQRALPSWAPRRFVTDGTYTAVVTTQLWHHLFLGGGLCSLPTWEPPRSGELEVEEAKA